MSGYQGSDWFKSGVHLRNAGENDTQNLVRQADKQIADCSRQLQAAYDGALVVFSNFTGTDAEVACAQESLAAIKAVSQSLQDLHRRLVPTLTHTNSETALSYVAPSTQQNGHPLSALKAKEEQLQIEVNRCRRLAAENALLNKQLQSLRASSDQDSGFFSGRISSAGDIPAGQHTSASRTSSQDLPSDDPAKPVVTFDAVKSLATAGSWLQVLRAKLSGSSSSAGRSEQQGSADETASLPGMPAVQEDEVCEHEQPMRRSRSDMLHDRGDFRRISRRGGELGSRPSTAGRDSRAEYDGVSLAERDRRRRTNVLMDDMQEQDQIAPRGHFLNEELAARSALFSGN